MGAPKSGRKFARCFQRNFVQTLLGTRLTDRISNTRLYEKCGSILLSRAIKRETLRWLRHVLWMKDDELPKMFFLANCLGLNRKQVIRGWGRRMSQKKI